MRESARSAALERVGEAGAALGAGAATLGGQALRRIGGAVCDGAVRTLDWERGYLWRAADEMGNIILNPFGRQSAAAKVLAEPLVGEGAEISTGIGAVEGVELGVFGGPVGMLAGAAIGAAASTAAATLAFRDRESTEHRHTIWMFVR